MVQPRYNKGVYRDCPWCQGRGCLACPGEAEKAYQAAFPDGPQPVVTFDLTTPDHRDELRALGADLSRMQHPADIVEVLRDVRALDAQHRAEGVSPEEPAP